VETGLQPQAKTGGSAPFARAAGRLRKTDRRVPRCVTDRVGHGRFGGFWISPGAATMMFTSSGRDLAPPLESHFGRWRLAASPFNRPIRARLAEGALSWSARSGRRSCILTERRWPRRLWARERKLEPEAPGKLSHRGRAGPRGVLIMIPSGLERVPTRRIGPPPEALQAVNIRSTAVRGISDRSQRIGHRYPEPALTICQLANSLAGAQVRHGGGESMVKLVVRGLGVEGKLNHRALGPLRDQPE